jgi:hypothetical protein
VGNTGSDQTPAGLIYFNLLGTVVALPRLLYKKLCGKKISLTGLAQIEPERVLSKCKIKEMM